MTKLQKVRLLFRRLLNHRSVDGVFIGAVLALLALGLVSLQTVIVERQVTGQASHTDEILDEIQGTLSALTDAETGQRGYLLTGASEYLEPYKGANQRLAVSLNRLQHLTVDNPSEQQWLQTVRKLVSRKEAELENTVALYQRGEVEEALRVVRSGIGKDAMDGIRSQMERMQAEEERTLAARRNAGDRARVMAAAADITLAGFAIALLWVLRSRSAREVAEKHFSAMAMTRLRDTAELCAGRDRPHQECIEAILSTALLISGAPKGDIRLRDWDEDDVKFVAQQGLSTEFLEFFATVEEGNSTTWGAALLSHRPAMSEDVSRGMLFASDAAKEVLLRAGIVAVHSTALIGNSNRVLGVLSLHFAQPHRLGPREAQLLELLSHQASNYLERKRADKALHAVSLRLRRTLDTAETGLVHVSRDLHYLSANAAYAKLAGLPVQQIVGQPMGEVLGAAALEVIRPYIEQVLRGERVQYEAQIPWPAPNQRWIHAVYSPYYESSGEISGWVASVRDITASKQAEAALVQSEQHFRQLAELLPQLVWTCRADGSCDYLGPQWIAYTGLPESQQLGYGWLEQVHAEDRDRVIAGWNAAAPTGGLFDAEFRIRRHDGAYRWFRTRALALRDAEGRIVKWFGSNTDIEDAKQAEKTLLEADRRKDEFLATLAHELRNPLAPVRYAAAMLRPTTPAPMLEKARQTIERQSTHLARLLDDLLDVSRITRNAITLSLETLDLRNSVQEALELARPACQGRGHRVTVSLPLEPVWVQADAERLVQIVGNLLNNAVKYTEPGGTITVSVATLGADAVLEIQDSGIGFTAAAAPKLFQLFSQLHNGSKMASGGLGIGLAVVKQLVQLHDGRIEARSAGAGQGATFTVHLPIALPPPNDVSVGATVTPLFGQSLRVLVIEDNIDAAESLAVLLRSNGLSVHVAHSGLDGIQLARSHQPGVVVLDIGLPDMSGTEVAQQLRRMDWARNLRIIAVSGWATEADRARSRAAGIDFHMAKPVDPDRLLEVINGVAGRSVSRPA